MKAAAQAQTDHRCRNAYQNRKATNADQAIEHEDFLNKEKIPRTMVNIFKFRLNATNHKYGINTHVSHDFNIVKARQLIEEHGSAGVTDLVKPVGAGEHTGDDSMRGEFD